ncbi:hypothetical protein L484_002428 [Morus notabilis]|uniref:FLZ-type domain-containing protein n=1 Tax=Morus notabilis TaxID=981085 RepID=W9QW95_9ROSA|nr:uncharacterized protein LOC21385999 [Morus notabilis]EXB22114.1 hypothetical protein L484_002428 [Morus notabilis]
MPIKRSRINGSYDDNDVIYQLPRPSELRIGAQTPPAAVEEAQVRRGILTLSPPEDFERKVPDNFLEKCWYCHKKIQKGKDIFMYCQFRAFCTRECRQIVIDMEDNTLEKLSKISTQYRMEVPSGKMTDVKIFEQDY